MASQPGDDIPLPPVAKILERLEENQDLELLEETVRGNISGSIQSAYEVLCFTDEFSELSCAMRFHKMKKLIETATASALKLIALQEAHKEAVRIRREEPRDG